MTAGSEQVITHRPLAARVEALAGFGIPAAEIALVLSIDTAELEAEYESELASGHVKANARVAESLFRKATGDGREAVVAAIFWLKTRARWSETSIHLHGGSIHNPISCMIRHEDRDL